MCLVAGTIVVVVGEHGGPIRLEEIVRVEMIVNIVVIVVVIVIIIDAIIAVCVVVVAAAAVDDKVIGIRTIVAIVAAVTVFITVCANNDILVLSIGFA